MRVLVWLCLLLFPCSALGEMTLSPSAPVVQAGEVIDFTVQAAEDTALLYTLRLDGDVIVESQSCAYTYVSYVPRKAGQYELTVTDSALQRIGETVCGKHFLQNGFLFGNKGKHWGSSLCKI